MMLVQHAQSHVTAGRPLRLFVTCWCSSIPTASGVDQTNHALAGGPHTRNHPAECPGKTCVLLLCTWLIRVMTGVYSSISIHYTVIVRATCRMLAWYVFLPPLPSPLLFIPPSSLSLCVCVSALSFLLVFLLLPLQPHTLNPHLPVSTVCLEIPRPTLRSSVATPRRPSLPRPRRRLAWKHTSTLCRPNSVSVDVLPMCRLRAGLSP